MNTQPEEELLMPKKVCGKCGIKLEPQEQYLCWSCDPKNKGEGGSTDYLYDDWSDNEEE